MFLPAALVAAPAGAQLFTDGTAREQAEKNSSEIENIKNLLRDLNSSINTLEKAREQFIVLTQKNQTMTQQVRQLGGRLEELERQLATTIQAQETGARTRRITLEKTLAETRDDLDAAQAQITIIQNQLQDALAFITLPPENELYDIAYSDYQNNALSKAAEGFNRVLFYYPEGEFSIKCRYWLAQIYLQQKNYAAARENADILITRYEKNDLTAEALLILAEALSGLGFDAEAENQLRKLITNYPTSLAADSARQRLQ